MIDLQVLKNDPCLCLYSYFFASLSRGFRMSFYLIIYNLAILTFWNSKIVFLQINEEYFCSLQLLFLNWAKFIYSSCLFTCKIDIPFIWVTMRIKYLTLKGIQKIALRKAIFLSECICLKVVWTNYYDYIFKLLD